VFLGDSIIQGGQWHDIFPDLRIANRGIGGDTTSDVLRRLDSTIQQPRAVCLLIGTNDLHGPRQGREIGGIAQRTDEIVRRIREKAPDAPILLHGVLPRTSYFTPRIRELNERYRATAGRYDATYVDLWPTFADTTGQMRKEFSRDSLHLVPAAYLKWAEVLRPHLVQLAVN
jgi:lysophospholipase L1-like esterase